MKVNKALSLFLATAIVASGMTATSSVVIAESAQAAVSQSQVDTAVNQILKETNAHRVKAGLKPLTLVPALNVVSQNWSKKMGDTKTLKHNMNMGREYPKGYLGYGENIAWGYSYNSVVTGWMNSPGHKANILDKDYTHIGIGYYVDSDGSTWFTQNFGTYPIVKAPPVIDEFDASPWKNGFTAYWHEWDSEEAHNFKIDVYSGNSLIQSTISDNNEVIVDDLQPNSSYTVKVTSRNIDYITKKVYSSPVYTTTVKTPVSGIDPEYDPVSAPKPVTSLYADVGYTLGDAGVGWDYPDDFTGYLNYYILTLKASGHPDLVIKTKQSGFEFTDLKPGTTYTANVQAMIVGYDGQETRLSPNKSVSFNIPSDPSMVNSSNVTNLKAITTSDTTMTASWIAPKGVLGKIDKYTVLINQGNKTVKNLITKNTSYKVTGLKPDTEYSIRVFAHAVSNDSQNESISKATSANFTTTNITVAKASKPNAKIFTTSSNVSVTWSKPATTGNLTNYTVTLKDGSKVVKEISTTSLKASFSKLKENTKYIVEIKANVVSADKKNKGYSATTVSAKTKLTAASIVNVKKPSSLKANIKRTSFTATWKKPVVTGKILNYKIIVKNGKKTVKTITTKSRKVTIKGLRSNSSYSVSVKANASSSNGKYKTSSGYSTKVLKTKH